MLRFAFLTLAAVAGLLVLATVLPLIPTEWWAARLIDFPRLQILAALVLTGFAALLFARTRPRSTLLVVLPVVAAIVVNAAILWPYRPSRDNKLTACPDERRLSVLIANVQLGNHRSAPLIEAVRQAQPDLFLAMETDEWWDRELDPLKAMMPHTLKRITGSYYGIHFFSRLPLVRSDVRNLAGADTPSVITGLVMPTGEVIDFVGIHPKPPQMFQSARARDAQLYAAAALLRDRIEPGILAGDLNATPWEIAVERTRRLVSMIDPRRGYGYVATWNAQSSWARWPLDHIFHEGGFATLSLERLGAFGSDHFPYLVRLCRVPDDQGQEAPSADAGDLAAANALLDEFGAEIRLRDTKPARPSRPPG